MPGGGSGAAGSSANVPAGVDPATYGTLVNQWKNGGTRAFGNGNNEVEGVWTTLSRINPFASGRAEMEANERRGDDMMTAAQQDWRSAGRKLQAGDVDGYMQDYRSYVSKLRDANGYYSAAESGKAQMADQAMNQAQQTFNASTEALSALSNPAGYAIGKGVSYGTTKLVDYAAPNMDPTLKKVLITGVSFVGSSYGSGLASGMNPNIMKPLVETGIKTDVATTLAQTYVTYHTEGGKAAAVDLILGAATITASNYRGSGGKTLGETISGTGQQHGAAVKDTVSGVVTKVNDTVKALTGPSEGGQALHQADDAAYHNPKGDPSAGPTSTGPPPKPDPITGRQEHGPTNTQPAPPLDPKVRQQIDATPPPKFSDDTNQALLATGNHPDAVRKLQQATDATGVAVAIPGGGNPQHQADVLAGRAGQKMMGMDTKSIASTGDIPFHPNKGKMGDTFQRAAADYRAARADAARPGAGPAAQQRLADARTRVQAARADIRAGFQQNLRGIKDGRWSAAYDPTSKAKVMFDNSTTPPRKIKPDIDPITTNANHANRGAPTNRYDGIGICTPAEARWHQAAAHSQGPNALTNHASDVNSPHGPKPLASEMVFIVPGKPPQVVRGHDNIVGHMDTLGMDVHPTWRNQAATATQARNATAASTSAGRTARSVVFGPSTDRATAEQHQLRQTRIESQNQYMREARTAASHYPGAEGKASAARVNQRVGRDYASNVSQYSRGQQQYTSFQRSAVAANTATGAGQTRALSAYGGSRTAMQRSLAQHGARQSRVSRAVGSTFSPKPAGRFGSLNVEGLLHVALRLPLFMPPGFAAAADEAADEGPTPWRDDEYGRITLAAAEAFAGDMALLLGQEPAVPAAADGSPILQSEVHVQVHELSSPAWRADFERRPAFHEGVVEYFTRQVMNDVERNGAPASASYPAFANEVAVAYRLATLAGEDGLRQAYFMGNMRLLYYRLGQRLGVAGVAQSEASGRRFLDQASLLMNRGRYEEVQTGFGRYLPPQRAGARHAARPSIPYRSGS